jgi:putative Ca2+/H+ antiporter (TMEM165/GDT1 family)
LSFKLSIVLAVFPVIFIGELPDKTMFASLVLSSRGKPRWVWLGAAGAFLLHVVIAVTIGVGLFHLFPHRVVEGVVAFLFLVGAVLAYRESKAGDEDEAVDPDPGGERKIVTTAFVVIFIAEWGDLTQILTANLAAHYHSPVSVGVGAVLALWAVAAIAVIGGQTLLRFLKVSTLRLVTAVVLLVLAVIAAVSAIK